MATEYRRRYFGRKLHWPKIDKSLLSGAHKPMPVRRKEISKPNGGMRLLGIPTVLDRSIQSRSKSGIFNKAIAQILEQIWEPLISELSYGFRPGGPKSA